MGARGLKQDLSLLTGFLGIQLSSFAALTCQSACGHIPFPVQLAPMGSDTSHQVKRILKGL